MAADASAGTRSCASTARSNRSSPSSGGRVRSNSFSDPARHECKPRINTVGSGAEHVGRRHVPESMIVGLDGVLLRAKHTISASRYRYQFASLKGLKSL